MNLFEYLEMEDGKIASLVMLVQRHELSSREAAKALLGWRMKNNPQIRERLKSNVPFNFDERLHACEIEIVTRL